MTALTPCARLDCGNVPDCPACHPADWPTAFLGRREGDDPMFAEVAPAQQQPSEMVLRLRAETEIARLADELADTKARLARLVADNTQLVAALVAERRAHDAVRDVLARHITTNAARSQQGAMASQQQAASSRAAFVDPDLPQATHKPLPLRAITQTRQRIGLMAP